MKENYATLTENLSFSGTLLELSELSVELENTK
jgi:hypothetical protein